MARRSFELTCIMREDLMNAYRGVYSKCHSQGEAYYKTVKHPAPRFYVTPTQAYNMMRPIVAGDFSKLNALPPLKRNMYIEMFNVLRALTQKQEFMGKSLWFICPFLVTHPASEFYLSKNTFKDIFPSIKKHGKNYRFNDTRSRGKEQNK